VCDYSADPEMRLAKRRRRNGVTSIVRSLETGDCGQETGRCFNASGGRPMRTFDYCKRR
jgi:hypothetical protein